MTAIKICGITRQEDAQLLAELKVEAIGLNFWPKSKRFISQALAKELVLCVRETHPEVIIVGVFVNQGLQEMRETADIVGLDRIQLHGDEDDAVAVSLGERCIRAFPLASIDDLFAIENSSVASLLIDSHSKERGGSGLVANWELAKKVAAKPKQLWLAGGLHAGNVASAIATVGPFGVDVASGVELSPGIKSRERTIAFVEAVRGKQ